MKEDGRYVAISIAGAWVLIIITKLLTGDFITQTKLLEVGSFDVKLETVLVGLYTFVAYLVIAQLIKRG